MDKKGICVFLVVMLALAYGAVPAMLAFGWIVFDDPNLLNNLMVLLVLWMPALAALIAAMVSPQSGVDRPKVWPVSGVALLGITLGVAGMFLLTYLLTLLLGMTEVQWGVGTLMNKINAMMQQPLTPSVAAIAPGILLVGGFLLSLVLGPTLFAAVLLGTELGWRRYLLPRLLPLGRWKAYLLTGVLWALSYLPLMYAMCVATDTSTPYWMVILKNSLMLVVLSIVLGETVRRTGHAGLAAVVLGCFMAQAYEGMWQYLFPMSYDPWTGATGVLSIVLWGVASLVLVFYKRNNETDAVVAGKG